VADLDKMACEILDSRPDAAFGTAADFTGHAYVVLESEARCAIRTALQTAPPGYVLVPDSIDPAAAMKVLAGDGLGRADDDADLHQVFGWLLLFWKEYLQKLAAAPEVK